jgi:hypothetical protein
MHQLLFLGPQVTRNQRADRSGIFDVFARVNHNDARCATYPLMCFGGVSANQNQSNTLSHDSKNTLRPLFPTQICISPSNHIHNTRAHLHDEITHTRHMPPFLYSHTDTQEQPQRIPFLFFPARTHTT